jgi:UDP-N-acetylmuramate dehydrogenase
MKRDKQVLDLPSAGCVFKNPEDSQFTTGQMIDMLGLKGRAMGGAQVSLKHANFIINKGQASCEDVLKLVDVIKKKVMDNYNISLELEIKVI